MNEIDAPIRSALRHLVDAAPPLGDAPLTTTIVPNTLGPLRRSTMVAAVAAVGLTTLGVAAIVTRDTAPSPTTPASAGTQAADQYLAELIRAAGPFAGWTVQLPADLTSSSAVHEPNGASYAEIHLQLAADTTMQVSVRAGDPQAAASSDGRDGLLRTDGSARVYVGTDGPDARAVELVDGATIVYVRSESGTPASLDELTNAALTINRQWSPENLTFDDEHNATTSAVTTETPPPTPTTVAQIAADDVCDAAPPATWMSTGPIHTIVMAADQATVRVTASPGTVCPGGTTRITITFDNDGDDPITVDRPTVILSRDIDKWQVAEIDSFTVQPGQRHTATVDAVVPLVQPGQYGLFVYGYGPGGVLFVDEPTP